MKKHPLTYRQQEKLWHDSYNQTTEMTPEQILARAASMHFLGSPVEARCYRIAAYRRRAEYRRTETQPGRQTPNIYRLNIFTGAEIEANS